MGTNKPRDTQQMHQQTVNGVYQEVAAELNLEIDQIAPGANLLDLDADSASALGILLRLGQRFDIALSADEVLENEARCLSKISVSHLVNCVHAAVQRIAK